MRGVLLCGDRAVDFSALHADGIRFAVLSATAGENRITPHWAEDALSARRVGIGVAICHDLEARSVTEALAEADHFLRVLDTLDFPPLWAICRVESPRLSRDPALLACMIRAFTERIRGGGFRPMLSTTETYLKFVPLPCDLYLARWSVPEARALARNPRIWEYGEGKAGDIPHAILLRGYFSSLPDSVVPLRTQRSYDRP
ncbi:MAG: hypothetical protein IIW82_03685 [Clostridia bacterium]|nr:hypothetical protein [Clostridia bacterium]